METFGPPQSIYLDGKTGVIPTPPAPTREEGYPRRIQSKPEKESEMYPQCRCVRPSSDRCNAAAIKANHWCYFHARLHEQQAQQAKRTVQEAERRSRDAIRQPRLANGTFAPPQETIDQGTYPVSSATEPGASSPSAGY